MRELSSINIKWDGDTDPNNAGWLMHYVSDDGSDYTAFSAPHYHLTRGASDKVIRVAVMRTLYDQRMRRTDDCALTIERD